VRSVAASTLATRAQPKLPGLTIRRYDLAAARKVRYSWKTSPGITPMVGVLAAGLDR
jgi:hypothetical protein